MASGLDQSDSILEPAVECMPRQELDAYHDEKLAELSNLLLRPGAADHEALG